MLIFSTPRQNYARAALLSLLMAFSISVEAQEPAYITDQIKVLLRSGKGIQYKILSRITSGTPVTVLEHDSPSGYSRIRLRNGTEGWLLTRYLSDKPSAHARLRQTSRELQQLTEENARLKQELESLQAQQRTLADQKTELSDRTGQLTSEIQRIRNVAANALAIESERNQLREKVANLERNLKQLQLENRALNSDNSQRWFLIGAGVLVGGLVLGLILPHLRWRRRHQWNSL
ncbi:TIGR04211 family SH3 domain-containing protein [Methylohalobius crimeensis]|uniref:TIGR04211 family SH3 domain-containing protein n=1 Tax=Methylohalobius crimeensis TaxID=244365 RepID=UPI0003B62D4E|nr:TIGR04211 family SH3 domain-containing protein [Methylohalobius crimeensis]